MLDVENISMNYVKKEVYNKFKVTLENEVRLIGDFE